MIKCDSENLLDVALLEIAEGLLSYEFGTPGEVPSGLPPMAETPAVASTDEAAQNPDAQ